MEIIRSSLRYAILHNRKGDNMRNLKTKLIAAGSTFALAGMFSLANPSDTFAAEFDANSWSARSVSEVQADIENSKAGTGYTFQWGDTLSAIASATDLSVTKLTEINDINNANVIFAGNSIYLSGDKKTVTVKQNNDVKSYDVSEEKVKEVDTPKEAKAEAAKPAKETTKKAAATETVKETDKKEASKIEAKSNKETKTAAEPEVKSEAPKAETKSESKTETKSESKSGKWVSVRATAYSTNQPELSDTTATGINLHNNPSVIAVDPSVIPLGSKVYIPGYGNFVAGDTGGAINGNRIDIHMTSLNSARAFGRKTMEIQIVE